MRLFTQVRALTRRATYLWHTLNAALLYFMLAFLSYVLAATNNPPPIYTPPPVATSTTIPNAADMLARITSQIPQLMKLVTAFAYVAGIYFIFVGIHKLKQFGEQRSMMSSHAELKGPLIFLVTGSALLFLPSTVEVGMSTFWEAEVTGFGYLAPGADQWTQLINSCFIAIQLFGTIAVIRGFILLSHLGGGHGQPGTFGRAMTHIIAGLFCINIYMFVKVVMATIGVSVAGFLVLGIYLIIEVLIMDILRGF